MISNRILLHNVKIVNYGNKSYYYKYIIMIIYEKVSPYYMIWVEIFQRTVNTILYYTVEAAVIAL